MFDDLDLAELGLELPEEKAAALKEALAAKGKAALDQAVTGLKSKNQELLGTIKSTKTELDQFKSQFEGLNIDSVKALLSKASSDEETRLLSEGKIDEVIAKRTERLRSGYEKQLEEAAGRASKAEAFVNQFKDKVLSDSIREAASKAGALPEAAEDIILRSRSTFQLNEHGEPVAVDRDGETIYGKDGRTPLTPLEWAESLRENAPHLWPRAQGAGNTGDGGGKATGKKRSDMSAEEAAAFVQKHGRDAYLKLPK